MLYELLAGKKPFTGATDLELLKTVIHGAPQPLDENIPLTLRMIVEKGLEKDPAERYQSMREMVVDLHRLARHKPKEAPREAPVPHARRRSWPWAVALVLALAAGMGLSRLWMAHPGAPANVRVERLTDFVGVEEQPAVSPDGKWVAFIAPDITPQKTRQRQVWVRLLAGGAPTPVTKDDADHEHPRWAPDSSSIVYFSGARKEGEPGTLWEVAAVGGTPRPIASSAGEGDVSHDGLHIVASRRKGGKISLLILSRDGKIEREKELPGYAGSFRSPRWSPDDRRIAFAGSRDVFNSTVYVMDAGDGAPKPVVSASNIQGVAWLPDGSGLVYASSAGSTMAYPPVFNLRTVSKDGGPERQLTSGEELYVEPDLVGAGSCSSAGSGCNPISGGTR